MTFQFTKATKSQARARIALIGPSGSGKTYTALKLAQGLGASVAVIDTENASASKYADEFEFDVLVLEEFSPQTYVRAIRAAEGAGYDVLIIDSLSHAWAGQGGVLEMVDRAAKKYRNNSFAAWRDVTPHHNALVDAMVRCQCHLIVTMRSKTHYDVQKDEKTGKMMPVKVGLAPVQRDGVEYEFDIVADLDLDHNLIVSKTRCRALDGAVISQPGEELAATIRDWLSDGEPARQPPRGPAPEPVPEPASKPAQANGGDPMTQFWSEVWDRDLGREKGQALLAEAGGDAAAALKLLAEAES